MRFTKLLFAAAAVAVLPGPASAQTVAGNWQVQYPMRVQNDNGVLTVDTGTATLTIEQRGDSIFGIWQALNTPVPAAPRTIVGTFKAGALQFTGSVVDAKIRRGDADEETIQMKTFYDGKLDGDAIKGTMRSESTDGSIRSSDLDWSAVRSK